MMDDTLEIVMFRLAPGVSREEFLTHSLDVAEWLKSQQGYIGRTLFEADGQWIDLVQWETLAHAQASAAAVASAPETKSFLATIDPSSVQMLHAAAVATY